MIPGAWPSRAATGEGSCDDAATMTTRPKLRRSPGSMVALWGTIVGLGGIGWLAPAASVAAHGPIPAEPPSAAILLLAWTFEPLPTLGIAVAGVWWWWAVRRVNAAHPANPVPVRRSVAFAAGLTAIAFALLSGIDGYDTTLFSVHMVQHLLLAMEIGRAHV